MSIYECPFCNLTLNRKYNLNTHIIRKPPGSEISPNLLSSSYQDNSEYNRHIAEYTKNLNQFTPLSPTYFNSKTRNSNHVTTISKSVINNRRKNKKFYSTIREFLQYLQIMPNNFLTYNNFIHINQYQILVSKTQFFLESIDAKIALKIHLLNSMVLIK